VRNWYPVVVGGGPVGVGLA